MLIFNAGNSPACCAGLNAGGHLVSGLLKE